MQTKGPCKAGLCKEFERKLFENNKNFLGDHFDNCNCTDMP